MENAERLDRLKAAIVDGLLFAVLWLLAHVLFLLWPAVLALSGYQFYLLTTKGQTIGKRLFKIRIVKADTLENGGFVTNVLLRSIVNGLLWFIPVYMVADSLLIFRQDRRCIHDILAGTIVVKAYG
ncbi:MAG: RDD family protein [Elusimicrobia bacterium]|nr:RDD family protein [Elusimicrobiota bacterium]